MNTKISIHKLAEALAERSGKDAAICEKFIKELFNTVAQGLESGETVHIKNLGVFTRTSSDAEPVAFIADEIFSDTVNAPFAIFQPEELHDEVTAELLESAVVDEHPEEKPTEQVLPVAPVTEIHEEIVVAEIPKPVDESTHVAVDTKPVIESETESQPDPTVDAEPIRESLVAEYIEETIESAPAATLESIETESPVVEDSRHEPESDHESSSTIVAETVEDETQDEPAYIPQPVEQSSSGFKSGFITGLIVGIALGAMAVFMFVMLTANDSPISDSDDETEYVESIV